MNISGIEVSLFITIEFNFRVFLRCYSGYAEFVGSNVDALYYQQNQADAMDLDRTVLETVMDGAPTDYMLTDIRALLGQFMFKGDDVNKVLKVLSGGEKARVALCKMMLTPANVLCLGTDFPVY